MTNLFSVDVNLAKLLHDSFGGRPHQERTDRVLEPLQAMLQLALSSDTCFHRLAVLHIRAGCWEAPGGAGDSRPVQSPGSALVVIHFI